MTRLRLTRFLLVALAALALTLGAVGAYAATRGGSDNRAADQLPAQQGADSTQTPGAEKPEPWIGLLAVPGKDVEGLVVRHVADGSPAADAGLAQGDVIVAADGTKLRDVNDLKALVDGKAVGDTVKLSVIKDGLNHPDAAPQDIDVKLGARPAREDLGGVLGGLGDIFKGGFGKFLGGEFRYQDSNGDEHKIEAVPGTVKSVDKDNLTIDVNGNDGDKTFDISNSPNVPGDLAEGDEVVVVLRDGAVQVVIPGLDKLPGLLPGLPGFGPGGHFGGHGFERFRDLLPKILPPGGGTSDNSGPEA